MKNIYRTLMALAAAFLLVPAAKAQSTFNPEKYVAYPQKGVGLNKYLKNTEPNDDGEYTLRIETFLTGSVNKTAIPTDFVLVLDCSGSMLFDCLYGEARPESVTEADAVGFLYEAHASDRIFKNYCHYAADKMFTSGDPGSAGSGSNTSWGPFRATTSYEAPSLYYHYETEHTYYKIHYENPSNAGTYYLYFTANDGKHYLKCTKDGSTYKTELVDSRSSATHGGENTILVVGYQGDKIYRPLQRREALEDGVDTFIDEVYSHNTTDHFAQGVTKKHQVSIVAFGSGYTSGESITPSDDTGSGTRVVKGFNEITASNKAEYKNTISTYFGFRGDTYTYYGMKLARLLLENEQGKPGMAPLNNQGGVNRNKVVVVFTDGVPGNLYSDGTISNGTGSKNAFNTVKLSLNEGRTIKAARTSVSGTQINGKIFSLDLSGNENAVPFLEHLSSNYPTGAATSGTDLGSIQYSGTAITPASDRIFYMDVNEEGGLEKAFAAIVDANTGNTSEHMVAVDVINDSFDLPEGISTSGKIKLFTAQCVGIKTIDGQQYLAFTDDVPVDSRPALDVIWYNSTDDHNNTVWTEMNNIDIDSDIQAVVNEETNTLVFKGFDFGNLWCGIDEDTDHNNTQQISEGMANYDIKDARYRGFKLIAEFPIVVKEDAVGGPNVPTNKFDLSGLFPSDASGNPGTDPIVNYPEPALTIPIKLIIQKTGLAQGESASFTIERKSISGTEWTEFTTFFLTGTGSSTNPEIRFINLDPSYYYRVKETGWSWAYENADPSFLPSTETGIGNPIVFENTPETDVPRRAEAKSVNTMRSWSTSTTTTVQDVLK